jgi:predicted GIY-YIG superfamily endonuclease
LFTPSLGFSLLGFPKTDYCTFDCTFLFSFYAHFNTTVDTHNTGENKATKPHIPYELIFYSGFINKTDAINCEQYYKTTAGWKRIHKMLENTLGDNLDL